MCAKLSWQGITSFAAAALLGLVGYYAFSVPRVTAPAPESSIPLHGSGVGAGPTPAEAKPATSKVRILSKPKPAYTDLARTNSTAGTVTLRVTFQADGEIGAVSVVERLPDGLTEQAIKAAKSIKFEPAMRNGAQVSVVMTVQYSFEIY